MCTKPKTILCDAHRQLAFSFCYLTDSLFFGISFCTSCVDYENQYAYRNCIFKAHANGKFELWYSWIVKRGSCRTRVGCLVFLWENPIVCETEYNMLS